MPGTERIAGAVQRTKEPYSRVGARLPGHVDGRREWRAWGRKGAERGIFRMAGGGVGGASPSEFALEFFDTESTVVVDELELSHLLPQ